MELPPDDMQQSHMTCGPSVEGEHRGNTPLLYPQFMSSILIVLGDVSYTDMQGSVWGVAKAPVIWGVFYAW